MKIVHETERVAKLKKVIKSLETDELEFLQEYISREKQSRKRVIYEEWLQLLNNVVTKQLH